MISNTNKEGKSIIIFCVRIYENLLENYLSRYVHLPGEMRI